MVQIYFGYILLVLAVLSDQGTTYLGLKKKSFEYGDFAKALQHEKNAIARGIYEKYGLNHGILAMFCIELFTALILAVAFETLHEGNSFVLIGIILGVPLNNIFQIYHKLKESQLTILIIKTILIALAFGFIDFFLLHLITTDLAIKLLVGEIFFLLTSPTLPYFYGKIEKSQPNKQLIKKAENYIKS